MEQSSSFVQYQPFELHSLHQKFQLDFLLHNGEEDTRAKRRKKSCVQVATCSGEPIFFHSDKFLLRIKSDCILKSGASGKPDSRMSVEPSSFDAASTSQVRLKDAYLRGLTEEQRGGPVASRRRRFRRLRQS